jgi:hypothetical protein
MPAPCLNTGRKSARRPALKFTLVPENVERRPPHGPDDSRRVRPDPIGGGYKYRNRRATTDRRGSVCFITDPVLGRRISRHEQQHRKPVVLPIGLSAIAVPVVRTKLCCVLLPPFRTAVELDEEPVRSSVALVAPVPVRLTLATFACCG